MDAEIKDLIEKITKLKKKKNCIILSHYYTRDEVQQVADFTGDSLALSQKAANNNADIILFAGVKFMAETAKVLSPSKKVILPVLEAGCSLADSCNSVELANFKASHPEYKVVSYVNTSVEVKALTDVCCTSSNALQVVNSFPKNQKLIFTPDENLGGYIKNITGRDDMLLWNGSCHVHNSISAQDVMYLKSRHPEALVLVHPECKSEVVELADYAGSTKGIIEFCRKSKYTEFIIVTEPGVLYEINKVAPDKHYYSIDNETNCVQCKYMKMINLHNIYDVLSNESPEIKLDESVRLKAERSIKAMLEIK